MATNSTDSGLGLKDTYSERIDLPPTIVCRAGNAIGQPILWGSSAHNASFEVVPVYQEVPYCDPTKAEKAVDAAWEKSTH